MEIFTSGPSDFYLSIYHIAQEAREKGLVFYGAGFWGDLSAQIFSLLGVEPSCFCDDDPEKIGCFYNNRIPILSFEESKRPPGFIPCVICIFWRSRAYWRL